MLLNNLKNKKTFLFKIIGLVACLIILSFFSQKIFKDRYSWGVEELKLAIKKCVLQKPKFDLNKGTFLYLGPDGAINSEKLVAYTDGSISVSDHPYKVCTYWKIGDDKLWQGEDKESNFSWELMAGFLPILITRHHYKGLELESIVFCEAESNPDKQDFCFKILNIKNAGKIVQDVHLLTKLLYMPNQQHFSGGFERLFGQNRNKIDTGSFLNFAKKRILSDSKFEEQIVTIEPGQVVARKIQISLNHAGLKRKEFIGWNNVEDKLVEARQYWSNRLSAFASRFDDCDDKKMMLAALMQILMADGEVIKPTCFYKTAFIRDGGMITHALNLAGFYDLSKKQLNYYIKHPWASAFGPEADAPGHLVWMVSDYVKVSGDIKWLEANWVSVKKSLDNIRDILETKTNFEKQGIKIAERFNGIVLGRMDHAMQPVYCNIWLLAGLREGAYLADLMGDHDIKDTSIALYDRYFADFIEYCEKNIESLKDKERTFIAGVYPTYIFQKEHDVVKELYRRRWPANNKWTAGQWPYFELAQAHAYFLLGDMDRSETIYEAIKERYPGCKYGIYYEGDETRFMPHLWAAAEAFCYYYSKLSLTKVRSINEK